MCSPLWLLLANVSLVLTFVLASVVTLLSILFWLPFVRARVVKGDYTIRWYHFFMGEHNSMRFLHVIHLGLPARSPTLEP